MTCFFGVYSLTVVNRGMLLWIFAVVSGVAASCTIACNTVATCSTSNSKVGSYKTHSEVVKSSKRFVVNVAFSQP